MAADWLKIRNEYVNSGTSHRKLAEKYGIPYATIRDRARKEEWSTARDAQRSKIVAKTEQKTAEAIATKEADRITRILSAADLLLARVEEAAGQLDTHIVTNKVKTKKVTYNSKSRPTKEVTTEEETKKVVPGPVDRLGLQQVAAALKSLKDTVQAMDGGGQGQGAEEDDPITKSLKEAQRDGVL